MAALELLYQPKAAEEIVDLAEHRMMAYGQDFARMRRIQQVMNSETVLPLPELSKAEEPAVANLALQGQDQLARRIASVAPAIYFPATSNNTQAAKDRARDRTRVCQGWHHDNRMKRRLGKRARYFLSYATAPVLIQPNNRLGDGLPQWFVRDPLHTLPATNLFDDLVPPDCIFITVWSYFDLVRFFGKGVVDRVAKPYGWDYTNDYNNHDVEFNVYEYIDSEERVLVLAGHNTDDSYQSTATTAVTLQRARNLTGRPLVVIPGRINLDAQMGHFDGIVGMYQTQAALMALTVKAQRRTIWPREWLVGRPGENPEIVSIPEPETGTPGELSGGDLQVQNLDPSFRALETMDRLEEAIRKDAGLPSEFGGLSPTNIRTGRRGAQVMGAAIDFTVAEAQDVFAESLEEEHKIAIAVDKAYFNRRKVYQISTRSYSGQVTYTPSELWETDAHVVDYPIAGTDIQSLPIEGGQRVAMGTLSREGFMEIDPLIKDPKAEIQRMDAEAIKTAYLGGLQTILSIPDSPMQLPDAMRLYELVASGTPLFEAMAKLQREAQERQATPAPTPVEAQPGIATPGQGVEQPEAIPEVDTSMNRFNQLLGSLGTTQTAQKFRGNA